MSAVHGVAAAPMLSWEPWHGLEDIVAGAWDGYISRFAQAAAAHGQPLFLRFAHEMNLRAIPWHGPPVAYLAAWRRVHAAFQDAGAGNVRWVWSPYVDGRGATHLAPYFPGTDLVDWVALDGYNWGRRRRWLQRRLSFDALFGRSLVTLRTLAPGKPVMLAEIGCAESGADKAAWMRDTLGVIPARYPEIRAVVWFNEHRRDHADWRVDSSPEALDAWREAASDARYALTGAEALQLHG